MGQNDENARVLHRSLQSRMQERPARLPLASRRSHTTTWVARFTMTLALGAGFLSRSDEAVSIRALDHTTLSTRSSNSSSASLAVLFSHAKWCFSQDRAL